MENINRLKDSKNGSHPFFYFSYFYLRSVSLKQEKLFAKNARNINYTKWPNIKKERKVPNLKVDIKIYFMNESKFLFKVEEDTMKNNLVMEDKQNQFLKKKLKPPKKLL